MNVSPQTFPPQHHSAEHQIQKLCTQLHLKQGELDLLFNETSTLNEKIRCLRMEADEKDELIQKLRHIHPQTEAEWCKERDQLRTALRNAQVQLRDLIELQVPRLTRQQSQSRKQTGSSDVQHTRSAATTPSKMDAPEQSLIKEPDPSSTAVAATEKLTERINELELSINAARRENHTLRTRIKKLEGEVHERNRGIEERDVAVRKLRDENLKLHQQVRNMRQGHTTTEEKYRAAVQNIGKLQDALTRLGSASSVVIKRSEELETMDRTAKEGLRDEWVALWKQHQAMEAHVQILKEEAVQTSTRHEQEIQERIAIENELRGSIDRLTEQLTNINRENIRLIDECNGLKADRDEQVQQTREERSSRNETGTPDLPSGGARREAALVATRSPLCEEAVDGPTSVHPSLPSRPLQVSRGYALLDLEGLRIENNLLRGELEALRSVLPTPEELEVLRVHRDRLVQEITGGGDRFPQRERMDTPHSPHAVASHEKTSPSMMFVPHAHGCATPPDASLLQQLGYAPTTLERLANQSLTPCFSLPVKEERRGLGAEWIVREHEELVEALTRVQTRLIEMLLKSTSAAQVLSAYVSAFCFVEAEKAMPHAPECQFSRLPVLNFFVEHVNGIEYNINHIHHVTRMMSQQLTVPTRRFLSHYHSPNNLLTPPIVHGSRNNTILPPVSAYYDGAMDASDFTRFERNNKGGTLDATSMLTAGNEYSTSTTTFSPLSTPCQMFPPGASPPAHFYGPESLEACRQLLMPNHDLSSGRAQTDQTKRNQTPITTRAQIYDEPKGSVGPNLDSSSTIEHATALLGSISQSTVQNDRIDRTANGIRENNMTYAGSKKKLLKNNEQR